METPPPKYCSEDEDMDSKSTATLDSDNDDPVVTIHPIESKDGVLVKVQPPVQPLDSTLDHIPCDIVLVIDVSGSMAAPAPAPASADSQRENEAFPISVLDLTKHAARTIVSTLNEGDRLGIVTFSNYATIVQELVPMTKAHKEEVNTKIGLMKPFGHTNLWSGISNGLKLFDPLDEGGNAPALMVLTDGLPNCMCPGQGYVNKLRSLSPLPAIINTFGFGYEIESGLLKSIAEVGSGNFAFIPDAGMIGTVFVHAVAHLQSTYATRCTLEISAPEGVLLKSTTGKSIHEPRDEKAGSSTITVHLDNLQYGQSRDIYLENVDQSGQQTTFRLQEKHRVMAVKLTFSRMKSPHYVVFADHDMLETSSLPGSVIAYHQSRSMICSLLSSFFELAPRSFEYKKLSWKHIGYYRRQLENVFNTIPARNYKDQHNVSLMEDLTGQIRQALSLQYYFMRWSGHFFLSLWNAHAKQLCNSFKDPGPLMYNNNPLFIKCRDLLDMAFDDIPPPVPVVINKWNRPADPCFAASSRVLLASGYEVPVCTLKQGMMVHTPVGPHRVQAVLKTAVRESVMSRVGNLIVTPWHPINADPSRVYNRRVWDFPANVTERTTTYSGIICSVLLEPHGDLDAHAIRVGDVWGVTLGHGVLDGSDVRAHPFFGDHNAVSKDLAGLGPGEDGVYWSAGTRKDADTGLVCGFECLPSPDVSDGEVWSGEAAKRVS
ncbi:U-box domain-containing protein [Xylaria longipes]|nr:U-box domain-containing protein [Xylaria longipes]RYC60176.1 hypothetical protein CHU98_g6027 [Xylaria longipes]